MWRRNCPRTRRSISNFGGSQPVRDRVLLRADLQRADQYREEAQRELTKTQFTNINEYLTSLAMEIRLERFNAFNLPRIAQLIQRSNQFNLITRRYGEAACEAMMKDRALAPLTLRLADKFGDYGLISVVILKHEGEDLEIDEYLMSCRVLQRGSKLSP